MKSLATAAAAFGLALCFSTPGNASGMWLGSCANFMTDVTHSTECATFPGINAPETTLTAFGETFNFVTKAEGSGTVTAGPLTTTNTAGTSGNWSVSSFGGYSEAVLAVKAGNGFIAYELDTSFLSGTWSTNGICVGNSGCPNIPSLSHIDLYEGGTRTTTTPLPAALPLMGTVLGAGYLVSLFRRRRSAAGSDPFALAPTA